MKLTVRDTPQCIQCNAHTIRWIPLVLLFIQMIQTPEWFYTNPWQNNSTKRMLQAIWQGPMYFLLAVLQIRLADLIIWTALIICEKIVCKNREYQVITPTKHNFTAVYHLWWCYTRNIDSSHALTAVLVIVSREICGPIQWFLAMMLHINRWVIRLPIYWVLTTWIW